MLRERTTFVVALTGGIASGKSAVARHFELAGVPLFDADIVAHSLVQRGQEPLREIASVFGSSVLDNSGALDRRRMRELVFEDAHARRELEKILHPRIHATLIDQVEGCNAPFCLLAIPLFIECQRDYTWVDRVMVTDVPRRVQIDRLVPVSYTHLWRNDFRGYTESVQRASTGNRRNFYVLERLEIFSVANLK